ncbi:MAG TPA: DoxX family protein [Runella sp.]|nr:DoxX family protein [Runella sp.]
MNLLRVNQDSQTTDLALLLLRVGIGVLMLTHGTPRLLVLLSDEPIRFVSVFGMSEKVSFILNILAEFFCSIFVIIGLGTRIASIPLAFVMAVAAFHIHLHDEFSIQEMSLHFLLVFVVLFLTGGGRYSLDYWLQQRVLARF